MDDLQLKGLQRNHEDFTGNKIVLVYEVKTSIRFSVIEIQKSDVVTPALVPSYILLSLVRISLEIG